MPVPVCTSVVWSSRWPVWILSVVLMGAAWVSLNAQTPPAGGAARLRREGTELVDKGGQFELLGGRVVFTVAEGGSRFVGLENLNLQRIARIMAGNPENSDWIVSGTVTEYQGDNYLLISRAARKTALPDRKAGY